MSIPIRHALVVVCHPREDSFTHAALARVLAGLGTAEVRVTDLYAEGFRAEMSADERRTHQDDPAGKTEIASHAADLAWCDTLILVYPTWWSGQPAMLKGWFDRVWVQGVAWTLPPGANRLRGLLTNIRRLVVVTSHGSSKLVNAIEGEAGKRTVSRGLRVLCHRWARTTWIALYSIDRRSAAERERFLERVERRVARLAESPLSSARSG